MRLDLDEVIRDVIALVRNEAQARRIEVSHAAFAALPWVSADRTQLQQVILNLVMNGLEAMGRATGGARAIHLAARPVGAQVQVDVRDSGEGIDPAVEGSLFEAFRTTKADGMGMGLAISWSIVESHGGRLWFTPNDGPGVTFSFALPIDAQAPGS